MEQGSSARATAARRRALGVAIRRHRGERSQTELAVSLGVSQGSVSNWEAGQVDLTCEQVVEIEATLGLRRGALLLEGGYLDAALLSIDAALFVALAKLDDAVSRLLWATLGSREPLGDPSGHEALPGE